MPAFLTQSIGKMKLAVTEVHVTGGREGGLFVRLTYYMCKWRWGGLGLEISRWELSHIDGV